MKTKLHVKSRKGRTNIGIRRSISCWICGLFLGAVSIHNALAQPDYTYEFTANPGQVTWYNGTTIEIQVELGAPYPSPPYDEYFYVVAMDFHADLDLGAYGTTPASLTPFTFSPSVQALETIDISILSADAFGWTGAFSGYGGGIDGIAGAYFIDSTEVVWGPNAGGGPQPIITVPATGTWSFVPDAASSLELFAAAMAALGAGRLLLRRPGNYGKT
jgi:hypothetical protein